MSLSRRLAQIADFVPQGSKLADIGTDHGYMPLYLLENDKVDFAAFCDVNEAPLNVAKMNLANTKISADRYVIKLGDGLEACRDIEVNTLTLSGMGASLILKILRADEEKLKEITTLILSPNIAPWLLRQDLPKLGFYLVKEALVEENGHNYEILLFHRGKGNSLTKEQIYFGQFLPYLPEARDYFSKRKQKDFHKIACMEKTKNQDLVKSEIDRLKQLWKWWEND